MAANAGLRARPSSLALVWTVARRELRDTLRDWRIVTPIILLTLFFPWLMNLTAQVAVEFIERREAAAIIGERLIPFLLMIVGFFPVSFSLIIALETFVGERERRSIEPLLSTPITDLELYLGKMLSSTVLPLSGALLSIGVYLAGLYVSIGYLPPGQLLVQILILNVVTAVMMVSGAVVVSSQTTSVRAANLLASFIIVPTALLMQAESIIMFWGYYDALWAMAGAMALIALILVRMGIRTFNREEILGREIDELNLRRSLRLVGHRFLRSPALQPAEEPASGPTLLHWLLRVYRRDLPWLLRRNWMPLAMAALFVLVAVALGWGLVDDYPLPVGILNLDDLSRQDFDALSSVSFLPSLTTGGILFHNVRVLLLAAFLAVISIGVLPILMLMVPMSLVGFIAGQVAAQGQDPLTFVAAFVLPHGVLEIPAAVIATAFAFRVGASLTAPPEGMTVGENLLLAVADLAKVFIFLVLPLLGLAAFLEANITPEIVLWAYGG
jgi:uncharacterized membrane protein SpoIIM required for sporulation/ABC-type transport system involved in multi-copper enzyme maturation permease subunit